MKALFELGTERHGRGSVNVRWQRDGSFVASCGVNGLVQIFDRHGVSQGEVGLPNAQSIVSMEWDKDGEVLAILQEKVSAVALYDLGRKKLTSIESGLKEPKFLCWSKTGPQLAIGGGNGTLMIYRKDTLRQETFVGKHSGAIVCGTWSETGNILALGSDDNTVSLSSAEGHTEEHFRVRSRPSSIQFAPPRAITLRGKDVAEAKQSDAGKQWLVGVATKSESVTLFSRGEQPVEMQFQSRYGKLVNFGWISNEQVAAGFSNGQVVAVTTTDADFGAEIFSERMHRTSLVDLVVSRALSRIASCGDSTIRVIDTQKWKELKSDSVSLDDEEGQLDRMHWTTDGQILSLSTKTGKLFNYLTKMPMVHDCYGAHIALLSSLKEISIINAVDMQLGVRVTPMKLTVEIEPSFVALGEDHVAVGMNNRAWFYRFNNTANGEPELVHEQEFLGSIDKLVLNATMFAALCEGRVYLHSIEKNRSQNDEDRSFPEPGCPDVSCIAMTPHLLLMASVGGVMELFSLVDGKPIAGSELRHERTIKRIYPKANGARILFIDECGAGYLYNPIDSQLLVVPDLSAETFRVLWDQVDHNVFVTVDLCELGTYVYAPLTINGPTLSKIGPLEVTESGDLVTEPLATQLPAGFLPIASFGGIVMCQSPNSQLSKVMLGSHEALHSQDMSEHGARLKFCQSLALRKLNDAWKMAIIVEARSHWLALSGRAMEEMNVEVAMRVWRKLGDAGMVMALERIRFVEDKYLLAGHVAELFGDYAQAQELFLLSPVPETALQMRKDLLHWEQALKLAEKLAPAEIPSLSVKFAQQLEFRGEFKPALETYLSAQQGFEKLGAVEKRKAFDAARNRAIPSFDLSVSKEGSSVLKSKSSTSAIKSTYHSDSSDAEGDEEKVREMKEPRRLKQQKPAEALEAKEAREREQQGEQDEFSVDEKLCRAGITRMTLRVGNIPKGVALALESSDKVLCRECAEILVSLKQFIDAATLFEKAGLYEDAASIYIKAKNFVAAAPLLAKVTAPKLHLQFAAAKEQEKDFRTAMNEYEIGKDLDSVVRIALEHLRQPEKAFAIVRKHQSVQSAELAARYCQSVNDFRGAIEFLLMAKKIPDAFELATSHDCMEVYEQALGAQGTPEEYHAIARFYESKKASDKAAEFYGLCGQYHKALKLHLANNEIEKAIDVVGKAKSDVLTHTLIDFLMGETTGVVQDPVHIFRLYMALGNFSQAARTAMVIAHQERETGNYRAAHSILYETHRELEQRGIRVPQSLRQAFLLLHSYLLVKRRAKIDDHIGAARLLVRVVSNISKFPSHAVPILTSAVVECQRGGLKQTAFEYATQLMRPENRGDLDANFRRKIETIVRKRGGEQLEDVADQRSLSPYSADMVNSYDLVCPTTKNQIPFCVLTGKHMVAHDWCICPNSRMPALYSEYVHYLTNVKSAEERVDPVLGKPVNVHELRRLEDPKPYLDAYSAHVDEEEPDEHNPASTLPNVNPAKDPIAA